MFRRFLVIVGIVSAMAVLLSTFLMGVGRASEARPASAEAVSSIHLPIIFNGYPSDQFTHVRLEVSAAQVSPGQPVSAGQPVTMTAVTLNGFEEPVFDSFFDVFVTLNGRSQHGSDLTPLSSNGDGTYSGVFTPTTSGTYYLGAWVVDGETEDKLPQGDTATVDVIATEMVALDLVSASPVAVNMLGRDQFMNPVPEPLLSAVNCSSDNPDITPGPVMPDPDSPQWGLQVGVQASGYGTAEFTCEYGPTGSIVTATVVHAPWHLRLQNPEGQEGRGFMTDSFFDVFVDVNPPGDGNGWQTLTGTVQIPGNSEVQFVDCQSTSPTQFEAFCTPQPLTGPTQSIDFSVVSAGEITQAVTPFTMTFDTPPAATAIMTDLMDVAAFNLYDPAVTPVPYDLSLLDVADVFPFAVKPTRQLTMQVYIVEGAATSAEVMTDVNVLEGSFNLNALLCNCDFYVDISLVTNTIPMTDWQTIDEDSDGLDRFDLNGDGDYDDAFENDDLENAKDEGYFDDGADTENVYYVPGIRGGALGTTYSPDGQVAVDNGRDPDNFTLFHEKIHELDLRHDGDFDINDSPDDPDNDQGARDPLNGMNYDDMGPFLTPQQCEELVS